MEVPTTADKSILFNKYYIFATARLLTVDPFVSCSTGL